METSERCALSVPPLPVDQGQEQIYLVRAYPVSQNMEESNTTLQILHLDADDSESGFGSTDNDGFGSLLASGGRTSVGFTSTLKDSSSMKALHWVVSSTWLFRIAGLFGLVQFLLSLVLTNIIRSGAQIGCILGGCIIFLFGMWFNRGLHTYLARSIWCIIFSIVIFGCAIKIYVDLSEIGACASLPSDYMSNSLQFYGDSSYYSAAESCTSSYGGQDFFASRSVCYCVNSYQSQGSNSCFCVNGSNDCNPILRQASALAKAIIAFAVLEFLVACLALFAVQKSIALGAIPPPTAHTTQRDQSGFYTASGQSIVGNSWNSGSFYYYYYYPYLDPVAASNIHSGTTLCGLYLCPQIGANTNSRYRSGGQHHYRGHHHYRHHHYSHHHNVDLHGLVHPISSALR
jgi:hypothetical protein